MSPLRAPHGRSRAQEETVVPRAMRGPLSDVALIATGHVPYLEALGPPVKERGCDSFPRNCRWAGDGEHSARSDNLLSDVRWNP